MDVPDHAGFLVLGRRAHRVYPLVLHRRAYESPVRRDSLSTDDDAGWVFCRSTLSQPKVAPREINRRADQCQDDRPSKSQNAQLTRSALKGPPTSAEFLSPGSVEKTNAARKFGSRPKYGFNTFRPRV